MASRKSKETMLWLPRFPASGSRNSNSSAHETLSNNARVKTCYTVECTVPSCFGDAEVTHDATVCCSVVYGLITPSYGANHFALAIRPPVSVVACPAISQWHFSYCRYLLRSEYSKDSSYHPILHGIDLGSIFVYIITLIRCKRLRDQIESLQ